MIGNYIECVFPNGRKYPGVIVGMSNGNMIFDIIALINADVITFEDLECFSDELKEQVKFIISR